MAPLTNRQKTKLKYKPGYSVLEGPGVWCTCVRGKEKQVIGELTDVFESIADKLWPKVAADGPSSKDEPDDDAEGSDEDMEKQLAKELSSMKSKKPNRRFKNIYIDIPCVVFISIQPPVEPIQLVLAYLQEIEQTKNVRTRNALRLTPVSETCTASVVDIVHLAKRLLPRYFESESITPCKYKIELKIRNNSKIKKDVLIPEMAKCVPLDRGHVVDLENPELVILVEVYQGTCGMAVVPQWIHFKRFNVLELLQSVNVEDKRGSEDPNVPTLET